MRRFIPLIAGVIGIVAIGLSVTLVLAMRRPDVDERAIPPPTFKFSCTEISTTNDFQQFLSDFRAAIRTEDKDKLFSFTSHCEFIWWDWWRHGIHLNSRDYLDTVSAGRLPPHLALEAVNARLVFQTQRDFLDNYGAIFTNDTRQRLLSAEVLPISDDYRCVRWRDNGLNYLCFRRLRGVGYKFVGNDWEP